MVKCCYPLKSESIYHKFDILIQIKGIEGIPFIIRFKTPSDHPITIFSIFSIEGIPVIIRFKTQETLGFKAEFKQGIEGIPFIIRFKTK